MSEDSGGIVVYRAATRFGRARTLQVFVDGAERATVRGSQKAQISLADGSHIVSAGYGALKAPGLEITVTAGQSTVLVLDVVPRTPDRASAAATAIVLRETRSSAERATAPNRVYPRIGNPRSRREQVIYVIGLVCLFGGLAVSHTAIRPVGAIFSGIGTVAVAVFFFRRFTYRK
ncbi:MAG: hypothetical protein M3Y42_09280 [Actinomycetota bacterium]|nr:hypothetical protein [Actinomycetota bacterium]MDQ2957144.1 hypothetical protein [Actinomycetota bacterium]